MKKLLTCIAAFAFAAPSFAQWSTSVNNTIHTNTGNVGIGSNSPNAKFEVHGAAIIGGNNNLDGQNISYLANSAKLLISWNRTGGAGETDFISNQGPGSLGGFSFYNFNNNSQLSQLMWIKGDGNVGIGATNPDQKLVVNGNIKIMLDQASPAKNVISITNLGYSGITGAQNWAIRGVYQHAFGVGQNADGGDLDIIKSFNGNTILGTKTDGSALGNVGIGTMDTYGFKLAVNGNIRAKEIKVESGPWPDYVFKSTYRLPSLSTVKAYIDKNQHLPDMPSEAEVAKNGVNLGELVKIQTKKIEELTLYLIEQNKQLKSQQRQITRQQNQIRQMNSKPERTRSSNR